MARGGSRYGAGRPGWRPKAEHCLRLDVREFKRRNLLAPGHFTWRWSYSAGECVGSAGVTIGRDSMNLMFSIDGRDAGHGVELERTDCTFGGFRTWFRCLQCRRRCAVLYLRSSMFRCRRCSGVAYASQSEDVIGRGWRRQQRLEARLGPYGQRPKGMHHATHQDLQAAVWACELERDDAIAMALSRLGFAL